MQEINLYHLLKYYAKNWVLILSLTVLGAAAGFVYNTFIQTPLYKSDATLILITPDGKQVSQDVSLINNYVELFKSRRVLQPVINDQKLNATYEDLLKSVTASSDKDTEIIKVSIATEDPRTSQSLLNGSVASFKKQAANLYNTDNVQIVDNASNPDKPYNVHSFVQLALATAVGFIIPLIGLFFSYDFNLNRTTQKKNVNNKINKNQRQKNTKKNGNSTIAEKILHILVGNPNNTPQKKSNKKTE